MFVTVVLTLKNFCSSSCYLLDCPAREKKHLRKPWKQNRILHMFLCIMYSKKSYALNLIRWKKKSCKCSTDEEDYTLCQRYFIILVLSVQFFVIIIVKIFLSRDVPQTGGCHYISNIRKYKNLFFYISRNIFQKYNKYIFYFIFQKYI